MLIPQSAGTEGNRAMEVTKEDDFVQKAFSAITHKDGLPEQLEASQVCRLYSSVGPEDLLPILTIP